MTTSPAPITAHACAETLAAFRDSGPLVQCLTNIVVSNWSANVLLAAGGAPAMVDNSYEAGLFAQVAGGVLVNLGTPYDDTVAAMEEAVRACGSSGTPWVLDPVAAGGLPWRTETARRLVTLAAPAIVRGNASEVIGLTGGAGGRGVDSTDTAEAALDAAGEYARTHGLTVAISGAIDHITDGERLVRVHNGQEIMTRVTGVGCSLGALMAGFAAVTDDRVLAAATATGLMTVAADAAVAESRGPGSFAVGLLDQLSRVTPEHLADTLRLDDGSAA